MLNKFQNSKSSSLLLFFAWFSILTIPWIPCLSSFWLHAPAELKDYQIEKQTLNGNALLVVENYKKHAESPAVGPVVKAASPPISFHYYHSNFSTQPLHLSYFPFNSVTRAPPFFTI